jgi:hypothetical protein
MDWMNRLTGFDLHEQAFVDQQVEFEMFFSLEVLVPDHHFVLAPNRMAP